MRHGSTDQKARRSPARREGFTLIEVIAVLVIVGIMAVVAVPALSSLSASRQGAAQKTILRDVTYARERAVCTGLRSWVSFSVAGSSYSVLGEPVGSPARASAVVLSDPGTGRTFLRAMNTGELAGVSLVSVAFDGGAEVGFDWRGKPLASTGSALGATGTVTITGGRTVIVRAGSGLVEAP